MEIASFYFIFYFASVYYAKKRTWFAIFNCRLGNSTNHRSSECDCGLKCVYTAVTFRCGRSGRTSSSHSRWIAWGEHDQIVFSGKTTMVRTSETHTCGTLIFLSLHSSRGSTYLSALLFDEDPGQQWQRTLPPVFITGDFPNSGKSFCTCLRNRCGGKGGKERDRKVEEDRIDSAKRKRAREIASVLLCVVLYKPTTTVRLPLLCRELITNPIARPPSYSDPTRLTFSTLSSILLRLPIGYLSARSIDQDSFLIPIYATATRIGVVDVVDLYELRSYLLSVIRESNELVYNTHTRAHMHTRERQVSECNLYFAMERI